MLNRADEPFSLFTMGDALDGYDKEEAAKVRRPCRYTLRGGGARV